MKERLTFSPENLAARRFESIGTDFVKRMVPDGPELYLADARVRFSRSSPAFSTRFSTMRTLFEEGYGTKRRIGEAFEDGAMIGTMITAIHQEGLLPAVLDKFDRTTQSFEDQYYRPADVPFSDRRMNLIRALRREGSKGYLSAGAAFEPIVAFVTDNKYETPVGRAALADGIGFMMSQVSWAYEENFDAFAYAFEVAEIDYPKSSDLQNKFAQEVMAIIEREALRPDAT